MSSIGAPEPPKPPIITEAPSGMPATASASVAILLSMNILPGRLPGRKLRCLVTAGNGFVRMLTFVQFA